LPFPLLLFFRFRFPPPSTAAAPAASAPPPTAPPTEIQSYCGCGNDGQGTCLITLIRSWPFVSQTNIATLTHYVWENNAHLFRTNGWIHLKRCSRSVYSQYEDIKHIFWERKKRRDKSDSMKRAGKIGMIK
jgi:hypothetical protein